MLNQIIKANLKKASATHTGQNRYNDQIESAVLGQFFFGLKKSSAADFSAFGFLVSQWVESLAQKQQEQRPASGRARADTEPQYKYWKNLKFLLDVDKPIKVSGLITFMMYHVYVSASVCVWPCFYGLSKQ